MMRDYDRITHILWAIDDALESTDGIAKEDFMENKDKRAAAERYVMIVGEAAHMVSENTKTRFPQIPWRDANDMRNIVAHEYMQVDYEEVWKVVTIDFPALEQQLLSIRKHFPPPPTS